MLSLAIESIGDQTPSDMGDLAICCMPSQGTYAGIVWTQRNIPREKIFLHSNVYAFDFQFFQMFFSCAIIAINDFLD